MTLADGLTRIDDFLLDRIFQKLADRLGDKPSAFDIGISLELGAVVLSVAADAVLFALGRLGWGDALWDVLNCVGGVFLYMFMNRERSMVRAGMMNPLRLTFRPLRLLVLGFSVWGLFTVATAGPSGRMVYELTALSNVAFMAGMYLVSCQPRPPGWRLAQRKTKPVNAIPSFT